MSLFSIVAKGGVLMILLAACSIAALAILIERIITLRRDEINTRAFLLEVKNRLLENDVESAVHFSRSTPGPVAAITQAGLERHNRPRVEIKEAIESAGKTAIHHLEKYLGVLATIATAAPLIGFLGTVTGMIRAFMRIEALGGNVNASVLAGGIWEALITTAAGLTVGIPALIFYNYLQGRVEKFIFQMEEASVDLLDTLSGKESSDEL
ncbi:MAG: MotA/TolQ/ExbB proton channel family protein [Gemmatimonadota bacterium]|nr:MAG: MotA/TolQ/ExbB proton channel family protein [Gemmatimonadota bacterium]